MKKLFKYLDGYKKYLFIGPFFKLLEAIFEVIVPLVTAKIIDNGISCGDTAYIKKMSVLCGKVCFRIRNCTQKRPLQTHKLIFKD